MPYYHTHCGGDILFWQRKCVKCGKRWPFPSIFAMSPPKDMRFYIKTPQIKKGKTDYAKWADKAMPGASTFASWLPNWPRWARVLSTLMFVGVLGGVAYLIFWR